MPRSPARFSRDAKLSRAGIEAPGPLITGKGAARQFKRHLLFSNLRRPRQRLELCDAAPVFCGALYQEKDLNLSGPRVQDLCSPPAMGYAVQVLTLPMPIMGER